MKSNLVDTLQLIPNIIVDSDNDRLCYCSLQRLDILQQVPNYKNYFDSDNKTLLELVGATKYFILYELYHETGLYIHGSKFTYFMEEARALVGDNLFSKIQAEFKKSKITFQESSINKLRKAFLIQNKKLHYAYAARILGISGRKVYKLRKESSKNRKTNKAFTK